MKQTISIILLLGLFIVADVAKADFAFGDPTNLGPPISTAYGDLTPCITADGLEMYVNYYNRPGNHGDWDIWISTRETVNDDWGAPVNLGSPLNIGQSNQASYISADGLELYCHSYNRSGGYGNWDLWLTARATRDDAWGVPENLGSVVNSSYQDTGPCISSDGLELYFSSHRSGGYGSADIWVSKRPTRNDPWEQPTNLGPVVNSSASENVPFLSSDGLLLFFSEERLNAPIRPGGFGNQDMWVTRRASISEPWGAPVNLGPIVNSQSLDAAPRVSPDSSTLYFNSDRPGGFGGVWGDIYQAPIIPIVDFNADEIVDIDDLLILIENWGTNETICDIGPMPWGDGIVDAQDLEVLMSHWQEEVLPVSLLAYWTLDETEGILAHDSMGDNDAFLLGNPTWQPDGGIVDGALALDGTMFLTADCVLSPADGPFSVLAWVKGGGPGQAILAQQGGVNWLMADPATGALMTELRSGGRLARTLCSQAIITDGTWHRIGLVWDGSNRYLYVDDMLVAEDAQSGLQGSFGGVLIGCGGTMTPGTFWEGLIDDVRIYNRAVHP